MARFLSDEQTAIAEQLEAVLAPTEVPDGIKAMISIIADTLNYVGGNGPNSVLMARAVGASIVELVEAGLPGEYQLAERAERRVQ